MTAPRPPRRTGWGPRIVASAAFAAAAAVLMAGCTGGSGGHEIRHAAGTASQQPGLSAGNLPATASVAAYYHQKLSWTGCSDGFQCARLLVPLDYRHPGGGRFSLPVIRLPASDPAHRIGSLVINPGGPGGSGIDYARQARSVIPAAVRTRFDVVGFDPRGVGGSIPSIRCMTGPQLDRYLETDDTPDNPAEMATLVSQSTFFARACEGQAGRLLPYVGTANAARDTDILRAALGDARLTFLGKSYGTYLGAYYAELFPRHVRALVLDGAVDPAGTAIGQNIAQAEGFEVALRSFAANCLRLPACPLAAGSAGSAASGTAVVTATALNAAISKVQGLLNQTDHTPLANDLGDGRPVNQAVVAAGMAAALYSKQYWPFLRKALDGAFAGDGTMLIQLADALYERNGNGQYSNLVESNTAINCVDRPWPRVLAVWRSAAATAGRDAPQFGAPIMWGSLPCAFWAVRGTPALRMRAAGAPPILVVGTTRDPATPYRWAQALARDLSSGVLLGWNGDGHTAYGMGSRCVDSIVDRYLIGTTPPASGTVCP